MYNGDMTIREKFLSTMEFDLTTPPPLWEMAYWIDTIDRWRHEGMVDFLGDNAEENRRQGKVHLDGRPVIHNSTGGTLELERPIEVFPGNYWVYPENKRPVRRMPPVSGCAKEGRPSRVR